MAWKDRLDALKGMVAEASQTAARVTRNAAAVTKSNLSILAEQEKQKKAYLELGKLYYRDFITGEEPDDAEYLPLCDAITEAAKNIDALRGDLEQARSAFVRPREEASEEPVPDLDAELENLHRELDQLEKDLSELDGAEKKVEEKVEDVKQAAEVVFEVVDDLPTEEPKE